MNLADYAEANRPQSGALDDVYTAKRYEEFALETPASVKQLVLDVGCSTGRGGTIFHRLRPQSTLVGVDCVPERLNKLPACYAQRFEGLCNALPFPDFHFDTILAGEILEHLYPVDVDSSLCELQRVLKVGGRLLVTTPNPGSFRNRFLGGTVYSTGHRTQHYPNILRLRLLSHGFRSVTFRGSGRATKIFGRYCPLLVVYGTYMAIARKA